MIILTQVSQSKIQIVLFAVSSHRTQEILLATSQKDATRLLRFFLTGKIRVNTIRWGDEF